MKKVSSIQPENETSDLAEFEIRDSLSINKLFIQLANAERDIYIFLDPGRRQFASEIAKTDNLSPDADVTILAPYDATIAQTCNPMTHYTAVTFDGGVKVQFSGIGVTAQKNPNSTEMVLVRPKRVYRIQRRNFFRLSTDESLSMQVKIEHDKLGGLFTLNDISLAGCNIHMPINTALLEPHTVFDDAELLIAGISGPIAVRLTVRNVSRQRDVAHESSVGCEMTVVKRTDENRLQRFLLGVERKQIARLSIDD